jgi:UDP-N-acetylmuramyl pentapeptide phosphotransferase/UDP-N-acetylglucosamine-1-phosphate transferase
MTVCGFTALAFGAALDRTASFVRCSAIAVAALPFLVRNLPPARVFLGDAGAAPLGFFAPAAGIAGTLAGTWPAWFPSPRVPAVRGRRGRDARAPARAPRAVWEAHRSHYYQRLVRLGAGHGGTLAAYAALMLGCGATAVACLAFAPGGRPLGPVGLGARIALLFAGIDYHWRQRA